jgi:hypothetical protein
VDPKKQKRVGQRVGLDVVEKNNISFPCRDSNPGLPTKIPFQYRLKEELKLNLSVTDLYGLNFGWRQVAGAGWRKRHLMQYYGLKNINLLHCPTLPVRACSCDATRSSLQHLEARRELYPHLLQANCNTVLIAHISIWFIVLVLIKFQQKQKLFETWVHNPWLQVQRCRARFLAPPDFF